MTKPLVVIDTEVYRDYFLLACRRVDDTEVVHLEMYEGHPFPIAAAKELAKSVTLVSFNGNHFDLPLLTLALLGGDCATIKKAADAIIVRGLKSWQIGRAHV